MIGIYQVHVTGKQDTVKIKEKHIRKERDYGLRNSFFLSGANHEIYNSFKYVFIWLKRTFVPLTVTTLINNNFTHFGDRIGRVENVPN